MSRQHACLHFPTEDVQLVPNLLNSTNQAPGSIPVYASLSSCVNVPLDYKWKYRMISCVNLGILQTAKLPCKLAVRPLFTFIPAASERMFSPCFFYHLLIPYCVTCSHLMSEKWCLGVAHVSRIILKTRNHLLPWMAVLLFSLHLSCLWFSRLAPACLHRGSLLQLPCCLCFWLFADFFLQSYTLLKYNLKQKEGINFFFFFLVLTSLSSNLFKIIFLQCLLGARHYNRVVTIQEPLAP